MFSTYNGQLLSFRTAFANFSVIRANSSFHIFRIIPRTLNSHCRRNFWNIFKRLSVQHVWVPFLSICIFTFLIWQNFLSFEYCKYFKGMGLLFQKKNFSLSDFIEIGVKWKMATSRVSKAHLLTCNADILENMAKSRKN